MSERLERVIEREAPAWGVRPVPEEHRRLGELDFAVLWGDLGVGMLVIVAGALLVPALGLGEALAAIVLGSVLGCIPLAMVSAAGAREGVPTMVLFRPVLGIRGSYAPTVINVAQLVGWTAFELWAMALIASRVTGPLFGVESFWIWLAVATALSLALSLGGPVLVVRRWMERFGVWVIGAVALWLTIRIFAEADVAALWARPGTGEGFTFWQGVDLAIALPISWLPLVADYSRFARRGVSSARGTFVGYLVANVWFYAIGALLVLAGSVAPFPGPAAVGEGILALAGGAVVLLALLVGETDEAFADIYSGAVSAQNVAPRVRQRWLIIGVAAAGVALAAWLFGQPGEGVLAYELFLFLIGSLFVPLAGVFVADYFVLGRRNHDERVLFDAGGPAAGARAASIAAWVLGFAAFHWIAPTGPSWWVELVNGVIGRPLLGPGGFSASVVAFGVALVAAWALGALSRRSAPGAGRSRPGPPTGPTSRS